MSKNNLIRRRVTVVMSDSLHRIHLVEVETQLRLVRDESGDSYRFDRDSVEHAAHARLRELGKESNDARARLGITTYDYVGTLVAHDGPHARGRITWGVEVETREAITL